jgi:hypothetical protein
MLGARFTTAVTRSKRETTRWTAVAAEGCGRYPRRARWSRQPRLRGDDVLHCTDNDRRLTRRRQRMQQATGQSIPCERPSQPPRAASPVPAGTPSRARSVPGDLAGHWCHHREPYPAAAPFLVRTEHGAQQQTNSERERTHERLQTTLLFIVPYLGAGVSAAPPGGKSGGGVQSSACCSGSKTYNFRYLHQTTHSNDKKRNTLARHDRSI